MSGWRGLSRRLSHVLAERFPDGLPNKSRILVGERFYCLVASDHLRYRRIAEVVCGTRLPAVLDNPAIHPAQLDVLHLRYREFVAPLRQARFFAAVEPKYRGDQRFFAKYPPEHLYTITDASLLADKRAVLASRLDADVLWDMSPLIGRMWRQSRSTYAAWRRYWGEKYFGTKQAPERKDFHSDEAFIKRANEWGRAMKVQRKLDASFTEYTTRYESVTRALQENPDITIGEFRARYGTGGGAGT